MDERDLEQIWNPRYPLAKLGREDLKRLALFALLTSGLFFLYHMLGSANTQTPWGASALVWLVQRWGDSGISMGSGDYSHGFLVPLASLYVVWLHRDGLIRAPKRINSWGIPLIALCFLGHYLGVKTELTRVSILALIGLSWSIPLYLFGWQVAKRLIFPCSFLIFAVPLNFLDNLTFPLRIVNTRASVAVLQNIGLEVRQIGSAIYGPPFDETASLKLDVADPCSGIRSLTAMMAMTAIYGYLVLWGIWRRWVLFLASIPLAMAGNIFRIVGITIIAEAINTELAAGLLHDYAGFMVFGFAIALMVALSMLLKKGTRPEAVP